MKRYKIVRIDEADYGCEGVAFDEKHQLTAWFVK